jgi:acyl-CoA synthetase (AMP-forming)/AMP-acid ligase II
VVVGDGDASALEPHGAIVRYDDLLASAEPSFAWPELDERAAAASCYTSGTTGNPKGVVYSHRSIWTHTFGAIAGGMQVQTGDRVLVIVPQFHANAWGLVHIGWISGADLLMPAEFLQPEPLTAFIEAERPTCSAAVPTVWNGVLSLGEQREIDLSSLRWVTVGGSAVPRAMIVAFEDRYGVEIVQGWGMTEMSPLGTVAVPPAGATGEASIDARARTGRIVPGVDMRLVDPDGVEQPWDGTSIGEIQVRGPWVTAGYHGVDATDRFQDGWLRTGDVGVIDRSGSMQIVDRTKDVIKSGGEWISSVDLENELMAHPDVVECAVIGVADERPHRRPRREPGVGPRAAGDRRTPRRRRRRHGRARHLHPPAAPADERAHAWQAIAEAERLGREHGVRVTGQVLEGHEVADAVLDAIRRRRREPGRHGLAGRSSTSNVFGALIDTIVGRSSVPLAVVRLGTPFRRVLLPVSADHLLPGGDRACASRSGWRAAGAEAPEPTTVLRTGPREVELPAQIAELGERVHHDPRRTDQAVGAFARADDLVVAAVAPTVSGLRAATTHLAWAAPDATLLVAVDVGRPANPGSTRPSTRREPRPPATRDGANGTSVSWSPSGCRPLGRPRPTSSTGSCGPPARTDHLMAWWPAGRSHPHVRATVTVRSPT